MKTKKVTLFALTLGLLVPMMLAKPVLAQTTPTDTLPQQVNTLRDRINGFEDRLATAEGDLSKLTKIKLSGYIQAQYFNYEQSSNYPYNNFMIRRARIKVTYEATNGVAFVLEPDFQPGNFSIKNAYAQINEPWLKTFSLWAGKFDRPDYEVEYSSSNLECLERSKVITTLYPDEKAIGFKLEVMPPKTHLKVQLALLNGNEGYTYTDGNKNPYDPNGVSPVNTINAAQNNVDFDGFKDLMLRATYAFKLGSFGGLNIGAHGYYGKVKANAYDLLNSDYTYNKAISNPGTSIRRNWAGVEAQLYMDVLGGLTLKGEYIFGINGAPGYYTTQANPPTVTTNSMSHDTLFQVQKTTTTISKVPAIERNFMGYYVYLIKNVGKRNQFAVRYDYYNPNTKINNDSIGYKRYSKSVSGTPTNKWTYSSGTNMVVATNAQTVTNTTNALSTINSTNDLALGTWTFAWTYFFSNNIKIQLAYSIPINETVPAATGVTYNTNGVVTGNKTGVIKGYTVNGVSGFYDYNNVIKQNFLTLRIQAKF
jgi:hypothetical protein